MPTFASAIALGVRYLETDVRTTRDGVAVAFHDATLDRVTNLSGRVNDRNWREVETALVAGSAEGIPRMVDVLGSFPGARFMIDVKDAYSIPALAEAIRHTGTAARVCVAGGWDAQLAQVRAACGPLVSVAMGWGSLARLLGAPPLPGMLAGLAGSGVAHTYAHVPWRLGAVPVLAHPERRARILDQARRWGVRVMAWTVNDPEDAAGLIDAGVAGVITDRPDLLRSVWEDRGWERPLGDD